jgi:tetratricopeptide (TPR) repeat protein
LGRLILSKLFYLLPVVLGLTTAALADNGTSASASSAEGAATTAAQVVAQPETTTTEAGAEDTGTSASADAATSASQSGAVTTTSLIANSESELPEWATSSTENLAPVNNVHPLPVGTEWAQRLYAVGISPETLWVAEGTTQTEEEQRSLMAHRHYFMGWYYLELSQPGRALEEFSEALKYDPENSHILLDAARAHLAVREVAEADKLINRVLDDETTNVEALRLRAESELAASDAASGDEKESLLKKAVADLEKARGLQPKNLEVLRGLAKAYVQQQEVEKVVSVYRDIVAVDPRDTYSLLILAQVLSRMDRPQEAIQYYQKVIEQRRSFIGGYIYLGQIYERMKRYGDALDLYKQAILVDPRNSDVLRRFEELVTEINGAKNTSKILAEYEKFVSEYPGNTEVRRIFAEKLAAENKLDRAAEQYQKILEIDPENVEACISLGKLYAQQKNYDKAGEYLRKAIDIDPEKLELYDSIASMLLAEGDAEQAVSIYRKAIDANPRSEKLYISLAALLENDDKTTEAIHVMENAIAKVGDKPELLAVLGKFYRSEGNTEKAETTLRRAYDSEPSNLPLYGELMAVYLEEGKTTAAEEITTKTAAKATPGKDVVFSVAGEFFFNSGRPARAVDLYLEALRANPTKIDYLARLVGISNRQKLFDQSLKFMEEFGGRMKEQDKVEQLRAEIYSDMGEHDKAIAIYRDLLAENSLDLGYYQSLIDVLNDAGKYDESLKIVQQAKDKFGKSDPDAVSMMTGMVYYKQKKYPQAEKAFKELLSRTDGKNDDAYYFLGSVYLDQEQYKKAEDAFRKAIEINPTSSNALNALGYMYADRGIKLDEAKKLIEQALEINPSAPHILDSMGWVLFKQGDLKGAEDYVERAARQFDDAEIYVHLGAIYAKQGKTELARETYQHALELDPDLKEVRQKLKELPGDNGKK